MHPCYDSIREQQADAWLLSTAKPRSTEKAEKLVQYSLFPFIICATHVDLEESLCLIATNAWVGPLPMTTLRMMHRRAWEGLPAAKEFLKDLHRQLVQPPMNGRGLADALERPYVIAGTIDVGPAWWNAQPLKPRLPGPLPLQPSPLHHQHCHPDSMAPGSPHPRPLHQHRPAPLLRRPLSLPHSLGEKARRGV
ncbi:hypothetical protein L7F22_048991 [Adiantum nelumboides]|nr:hypothetical protein [Adiantum nelumboides]